MMAYLKGGRRAVGEYDWLNGWQGRQEKAERFDESRRDEVDRSPGIRKGFIAARGSGGVEIGGKVGFGRVRRVWRVWRVGVGSTKAWTSLGEFGEFGEFGEWGAGSAKAWTSRGRHERMGVLDGRGGGLDLGGARNFQTGAFVYPVVSQTTVCTDPSSPGRRRFRSGEEYQPEFRQQQQSEKVDEGVDEIGGAGGRVDGSMEK